MHNPRAKKLTHELAKLSPAKSFHKRGSIPILCCTTHNMNGTILSANVIAKMKKTTLSIPIMPKEAPLFTFLRLSRCSNHLIHGLTRRKQLQQTNPAKNPHSAVSTMGNILTSNSINMVVIPGN
jgi:hypothetical protein